MFTRTIDPAFYDTDALGHINNTRLPAWFELARNDLFTLFTPDLDPKKWRLMMARMEVDYRAELFYGHPVELRTYLTRLGNSSFTVTQEAHQLGKLTNVGHTVMLQYDHQAKRALPIEGELRAALEAHLQDAPA
ncbi:MULTISPECIES: acyl-CoA thioesterase [unclassified Halomonas]|uniref:acyl-CoA thioesterase n=1 Tax=unclassified Halomonas TaxID=2609666 RepID=UPI0021E3E380|nr:MULTISPECIES: thioesterase family protein [unclassified Halomonas]UYF99535.1 acyl-CoA thioesterase [Halomonas sp. GD1P12]WNL39363.1 thioesterase family protein [Halomonas sp. PAMB 3232]WNL42715.1 thioesterase family protein [Halomonas sp. PAMB 3264]